MAKPYRSWPPSPAPRLFFFQAEDGIRDKLVTGVQTCALPISPYMGPWLAETVRQCDGLVQDMSYWTFSDVFEEGGVVKTPFYGGFGLLAAGGIPKRSGERRGGEECRSRGSPYS